MLKNLGETKPSPSLNVALPLSVLKYICTLKKREKVRKKRGFESST